MRTYSFFYILLLCLVLIIVDILSFYWLQSVVLLEVTPVIKTSIFILFWFFTLGLITAIVLFKLKIDSISPHRKHLLISKLYGLVVSSFIPKLLFVIIISVLYFSNSFFYEKDSLFMVITIGVLSGVLPFLVIIYGIFKSLYKFKVHHINIPFKTLPKSFNGLKIVQLSDIHIGSFNYQYSILERAIKKINQLKPDLLFITGDLVNNYAWELRGWEKVFNQLDSQIKKYAVLGNHDYGDYSKWNSIEAKEDNLNNIKQFYKSISFNLLLNESEIISKNNEQIAIIGVENWDKPPFKKYGDLSLATMHIKEIPFKILLSHSPTHWLEEIKNSTDIALTLSGHTHGMQAGFEYKNFKWSPIKYKYKYWAGLYQDKNQYLYVNRGLGWLGLPARIGMRPEITFIELKSLTAN